ncbi:MlaC/ttg2D family ABC transporter substrate-binding protein [Marinomonas communis]|jgi:phospholipid transport system substrate-binding protein|uniref:Phospholipid transport system substrate-binding protein n=1 Tax=Marinomonas communis TaxID=28254 RepID=A0A4R6X8G2_9GAMM|nr:ABC transporter substrate-binding protein [Marinomonas communis]TDR15395.1 phospholipid transport system substrate-binding protein [Marinomonas communis]
MRIKAIGIFLMSLLWVSQAFAAVNPEGAREEVLRVVDDFKTKIVDQRDVLEGDPQKLRSVMREIIAPVVDFDDLAKKVMGKYYRQASPKQISEFVSVTEGTLLKTYSAAVIDFDPSRLTVLPLARQKPGREVRVDAKFQLSDGSPVDIAFYMEPKSAKQWMLSNVVINNINFGLTFRKQFGVMMQQNGNDIDRAIAAWQSSLASGGE